MLKNRVLSNSLYSLFAGSIKLISGFVLLKWAVESFGKENLIYLGQLNSIFLISTSLASIGFYSGFVGLSSDKDIKYMIGSSLSYLLILSIPGFIILNILWAFTLKTELPYGSSIHLIVCLLFLSFPFQHLLLGIINIHLNPKYTYFCRIAASCLVLVVGYFVTRFSDGGFLINSMTGSAIFLIGIIILFKKNQSVFEVLRKSNISGGNPTIFLPFAKVFAFSIFVMPIAKIIVREYLLVESNGSLASYWQAYLTISDSYTVIFTVFMGSFYLKYAAENKDKNLLAVMCSIAVFLIPLFLIGFLIVFFLFPLLLYEILSFDIASNGDLRLGIISGDVFRFMTLLITYNFIVRGYVKASVFFELLQGLLYVAFIAYGFKKAYLEGASLGYAITYMILFMAVLLFSVVFRQNVPAR